jgi:hypothetical protein
MTHGNYALPGPKYWLANILDVDAHSVEFLSFHKLFRGFNWEPSQELVDHIFKKISSGEEIDGDDNAQIDIDKLVAEELSQQFLQANDKSTPLERIVQTLQLQQAAAQKQAPLTEEQAQRAAHALGDIPEGAERYGRIYEEERTI